MPGLVPTESRYVIVAPQSFQEGIKPLLSSGHGKTKAVFISENVIEENPRYRDLPKLDAIKKYLSDNHPDEYINARYVLIVGDDESLGISYCTIDADPRHICSVSHLALKNAKAAHDALAEIIKSKSVPDHMNLSQLKFFGESSGKTIFADIFNRARTILKQMGEDSHGIRVSIPMMSQTSVPFQAFSESISKSLGNVGTLEIGNEISFSIEVEGHDIRLKEIDGLMITRSNGERRAITNLINGRASDDVRYVTFEFGHAPVARKDIKSYNSKLSDLFEQKSYYPFIDYDKLSGAGRYQIRLRSDDRVLANLLPIDSATRPMILKSGVVIPMPKGKIIARFHNNGGPSELILQDGGDAKRDQIYIWIPNLADKTSSDEATVAFRAAIPELRERIGFERDPSLSRIIDSKDLNVYEIRGLSSFDVKAERVTAALPAEWSKTYDDLFDSNEAGGGSSSDSSSGPSTGRDLSFSFGDISFNSVKQCIVLDTSGSVGRPFGNLMQHGWPIALKIVDKVPSIARGMFLDAGLVTVDQKGANVVLPVRGMSDSGIEAMAEKIESARFRGTQGKIDDGVMLCTKELGLDPKKTEDLDKAKDQIVLLTDAEGRLKASSNLKFSVEILSIDDASVLSKIGEKGVAGAAEAFRKSMDEETLKDDLKVRLIAANMAIQKDIERNPKAKYSVRVLTDDEIDNISNVLGILKPAAKAEGIPIDAAPFETWKDAIGAVRSSDREVASKYLRTHLTNEAITAQSEITTQIAVATLRLLPADLAKPYRERLVEIADGEYDLPLKMEVMDTLIDLFVRGDESLKPILEKLSADEGLGFRMRTEQAIAKREAAKKKESLIDVYLEKVIQDPRSVNPLEIAKCGLSEKSVKALMHILEFGPEGQLSRMSYDEKLNRAITTILAPSGDSKAEAERRKLLPHAEDVFLRIINDKRRIPKGLERVAHEIGIPREKLVEVLKKMGQEID